MTTHPMLRRLFGRIAGRGLLALATATSLGLGAARADPVADFYKGRTVTMVIGYSVGGGYDLYARLLARHMARYIPGEPTIVPQSMPGAGSLKAISYLANVAPKDGATFGTFGRTMPIEPLMSGAKFDARKLTWLGSITHDTSLCVSWGASPIKSWDDLIDKGGRFGGQGAGSDPDVFASVLKNMFGSKLQLVTGYPGNNELALAMERGEIDGYCGLSLSSLTSRHADWLRDKKIHLLVQASIDKDPALPDVPTLVDKVTDPKKLQALKVFLLTQTLARPFAAPPGLPPERAQALRSAFDKTMADKDFRDEANKLGLDVAPIDGQHVGQMLDDVYALSPDILATAKQAVGY